MQYSNQQSTPALPCMQSMQKIQAMYVLSGWQALNITPSFKSITSQVLIMLSQYSIYPSERMHERHQVEIWVEGLSAHIFSRWHACVILLIKNSLIIAEYANIRSMGTKNFLHN